MKKILWILLPFYLLLGCSDDESEAPPVVTFESSSSQVEEDGSYKVAEVVLSEAAGNNVEVHFQTVGIATINGHYKLVTPSPVTIEAGSERGEIVFETIDNPVLEVDNATFTIELSSASGAQLGEATSLTHEVEIIDNNVVPANDLQLDLLWNIPGEEDIDQADLDLLLITDLVEEDGAVVDFTVVEASGEESGFESVLLQESHPDDDYYVVVFYAAGSQGVNFRIHASNMAWGTGKMTDDSFDASEVEGGRIYGPIPKEGSTYFGARKAGGGPSLSGAAIAPHLLKK